MPLAQQHAMLWLRRRGGKWALPEACQVVATKTGRPVGLACNVPCHGSWLRSRGDQWTLPAIYHVACGGWEDGGFACNMPCVVAAKTGGQWALPATYHVMAHGCDDGKADGSCLQHTMSWLMAATTGRPVGLAHSMPCHGCDDGEASGPCPQHAMSWLRRWGGQWALSTTCHAMAAKLGMGASGLCL